MTETEFDSIVEEAIADMPDRFMSALENISIVVEQEPPPEDLSDDCDAPEGSYCGDELLGLYDGVNILERCDGYDMDWPDVITIYQGPHERCFSDRAELVEEVKKTVIHEIGHYFGLEDDRLYEMGY